MMVRPDKLLVFPGWLLVVLLLVHSSAGADEAIEWMGTFSIPGTQVDQSGMEQQLEPGLGHNLFGGISALEYLGKDDLYLALPDRGPKDGEVDWTCRVHVVRLPLNRLETANRSAAAGFEVVSSSILKDGARCFTGLASRYEETESETARLDPEGIRLGPNGSFFLSDEYGPHLLEFTTDGKLLRRFKVPDRYQVKTPCLTKEDENRSNDCGRQGNQGLEGLAVSNDGDRLFALFQSSLLQDCSHRESGKPKGMNCRLLELDTKQESFREFLYPLDEPGNKLNEILAYGNQTFLVIERDGEAGTQSRFKKIMQVDLSDATEIQDRKSLPADSIPGEIQPVGKETFIDLLDERFGLAGKSMPEKIEGLTWGPELSDGRRTLLVATDNDFKIQQPTMIYCFAIGKTADKSARAETSESASPAGR